MPPLFFTRHALLLERLGLAAVLAGLTYLLVFTNATWRWDQAIYDGQIQLDSRPPPEDILIIAIDAESIEALGAWPWPRQHHAQLLRQLAQAKPGAIVMDIIFAEASNLQADQDLADAISETGKTLLPVLAEQGRQDAPLVETLPLPLLIAGAAGLGHTHVELDSDGMARSVYLKAGLGSPVWPSIGLAALRLIAPGLWEKLPGLRDPDGRQASPYTWTQDYRVLIPYAGPPGTFRRISYQHVLKGEVPPDVFRNKIVLVGATASGLGDALPTPVSGFSQPMPGVEIHANLIDAMRLGLLVEPLAYPWRLCVSLLLALFPALLFPYLSPRGTLLATAALLVLAAAASFFSLMVFRLWFPPVAPLIALALSHPLWSWRRLEFTMRYLNHELQSLAQEPTLLNLGSEPDVAGTLGFLQEIMPIAGWVLLAEDGNALEQGGQQPGPAPAGAGGTAWLCNPGNAWVGLARGGKAYRLGLRWSGDGLPTPEELRMLGELSRHWHEPTDAQPKGTVEMVETRIQQVQTATDRLRHMNQVVSDSLAEMADGVIIANAFGQIVLANGSAAGCLSGQGWSGRYLLEALHELELPEGLALSQMISKVLLQQNTGQFYAKARQRDLMVQLAPLTLGTHPGGIIVNITDITLLKASERRRLELLGFLSHDLRSPLVSMLALAELARSRLEPSQRLEDFLGRMENHTLTILGLADDFLNLIRAESQDDIQFRDIDLAFVAQNALDKVSPQADQKNIRLKERFEEEEAWCHGNADLIERALVNLLTNAVKYSPTGTEAVLSLSRADGCVECRVADQGPGIAANEIPHLFDAFRRAGGESQQAEPGYGLGLAFVKVVAQRHGGNVSIESELGKGSSFCLRLPIEKWAG